MAEVTNTNNIIQQYIKSHPELTNKTQEQILSIMIKNGVITPTEAQKISAFAKTSSVHNTDMPGLHFEKNKTNQAKTNYDIDFSYEEAQDFAIENISQNVQDAFAVFYAQDNGIITKGYDSIKEFFDGELSSKNVGDVLRNEQKSVEYLTKAKEGTLSKKQYYIENKERLKEMMLKRVYERDESTGDSFIDRMRGDLSKNEFAKLIETTIDARLDSLTNLGAEKSIKAIKGLQHQLVTMDDKALEEFLNELNKTAREQKIKSHNIEGQPSIKQPEIPIEFTSEEPMTFEEVYKLERGTNFNEALMENLAKNKGEINFAIGAFNKYNQFKTEADRLLDEYSEATKVYTDENNISTAGHEPNADLRADDVLNLYKSYYENSPDPDAAKKNLENIINKTNLPVQLKNEGNGDFTLDLSALGDNYRQNKVLNTILKMGIQEEKNKLDKLLGGKTIEEFAKNYETSYKATLGSENANELAKAMEADNMTAIQRYTGNTAMSGMGLMVIGGVLTVTPAAPLGGVLLAAGQVTALTGIAAKNMLGFTDALTRDEINEEEIKELSKNLAMDIGGFVIGGAAGRKGLEVGKALAEKGYSTLTSMVAEHGTDFTLSLAGDLAMMGALNSSDTAEGLTEGNFIGVLVSTVTGIRTSKYLYNTNKIETKTETYLDPVTKKAIEATYILNPKTNKYELAKNQYSRREIQTNIESIKYRNIDGRSNLIYLAEDTDIAKYGINTLEDLRKSNLITTEEKEVIENLYKHAEQLGYKDLYDKNLNVLAGFASTAEKVNGKLVTKFDNLDKNQFEVIKYITDQLHNGSIKGEYLSAIVSRIQDPIPYEVFKYADNPETLPDEIRRGDISWSKEQCQEWIKEIKTMEAFLNTQSIPSDIKVLRVDDYSVMNNINIDGKPLGELMNKAVNTGKIEELIARLNNFQNIEVKFDNFIGTTMPSQQPFSSHRNIIWEIDVPKGTHGAFLESAATSNTIYAEAEFLIQKDSSLKINGVEFKDGSWHIKAEVVDNTLQPKQKISQEGTEKKSKILDTEIKDAVTSIRTRYKNKADDIKKYLFDAGLNKIGIMTARLKGSQSLYDKIANYIKDHPTASLEEALKDVRDAFGARTIVKSADYKNHPEVKELLETGDERGAMLKAAELQSQPAVEKLKGMILAQAQGKDGLELARISNYVSDDGIPYFSEAQLAELKQFGAQHGVNVDYVVKIDKSDPNYAQMKAAGYKPTTKGQPSGYTALQMNFKTKTGETIEWQFRGEEVNRFAEGEHIPYDLRTGKNIIGEHKELEPLYNPIKELLSKDKMDDTVYKEYNRYLSDYYKHLRKLELGFESVEPKLADYGKGFKFDERLNAENLIALHDVAENLKKGKISQKEAIEQYNKKVFENTPQKVKTLSAKLLQKINDSQSIYDPTIIAVIGENLPKIQDGKILNYIKDELNSQYPNEYKILALTELENFKTGGYEALSPELKKIIQPESFYTQKNFDERLEEIKEIEDSTERTNKLSELNMMVGSKLFAISTNIRNLKSNENINYLYENYLMANVPNEYKQIMDEINEITGKKVLPQLGDIYLGKNNSDYISIPPDILKNFNKLQPQVKEIYKKYPDNLLSGEHYLSNAYIERFNSFTPKEIENFNKRNVIEYIDFLIADELNKICKMNDEDFTKIQKSGLLEKINIHYDSLTHKESPHLLFKDIEKLVNDLSLDEIQTLKDREITDIKDGYFINISPEFMTTLARLNDRQWDFVKNKLDLFKNNKLDLRMTKNETTGLPQIDLYERKRNAIISGIKLIKNSDSRIYSKILELKNIGIKPTDIMQIIGNCNDNFEHYGNYAHGKVKELIQKNIPEAKLADYTVPYISLQSIKGKSNINELSINEKRNLLKSLVKYNASLFDNNFNKLLESEIIPRNKDEYCSLLPKLVKAIGIDTRPVSKTVISGYEKAMDNMSKSDSEFLTTPITKDGFKLNLEYPRDKFISDILDKVKDLPETEKMKVFDYFGFEIKIHSDGQIQMNGYPVNINNGAKLGEITNPETKAIVESVRPFVEKFTHNNKISVDGKPELTEQLNEITELFPEFKSIIGKKQHETHDFTLDVHILKVLQGVMQDPDYQKLPADDKKILNITTLLHDLTKADGRRDKTHPQQSAFDAYYLLEKMNLTEADKLKIYSLIKNHNWLEQYNNKNLTETERLDVAKNIAFELREGNNFEMASILAKADTKGVKENGAFFDRFKNVLEEASNKIANLVDNLQKTAIHLPQTKLPKASEIKVDGQNIKEEITTDSKGNTIKNKVIYLKPDMDLGALGFEKGLKSEDLNVIVHALDYDTQSAIFQALGQVDSDALLSASYVNYKKGNYHVFRQQGFILDIASTDIHAGTYKDFGSGCGKDLKTLKADYLFGGIRHDIREFMPDRLKEKLKISDEEYKKLFNEISDKSISELDITHPHVSKAMREIFEEMEIHKRKYNRNYNEWLISRPKIQGIFWEGKKGNNTYSINDVPEYLRKYAEENNLPIIYFGE